MKRHFYIPADCEAAARHIIKALPPEQRPEKWYDGSYCRQTTECSLEWPHERHGREGRQVPTLRLHFEDVTRVWPGTALPVPTLRLSMDPVTGGWMKDEYSLPREWLEALRQGVPHFES